jgi:hypothetical protein
MPADQTLANILDETIIALSNLDSDRLQILEKQIVVLSNSTLKYTTDHAGSILQKKQSLETFLQNCATNLGVLKRLHAKNMRNQWAQ